MLAASVMIPVRKYIVDPNPAPMPPAAIDVLLRKVSSVSCLKTFHGGEHSKTDCEWHAGRHGKKPGRMRKGAGVERIPRATSKEAWDTGFLSKAHSMASPVGREALPKAWGVKLGLNRRFNMWQTLGAEKEAAEDYSCNRIEPRLGKRSQRELPRRRCAAYASKASNETGIVP